MTERFSQYLRRQSEPTWSAAVGHRFVTQLCDGSLPAPIMVDYLVQDHRFLDSFLTLLGAAIATADTFEARLRFGRFAGMISSDENTYFLRAFEALEVSPAQRTEPADTAPTAGFKAIMREAAATRSYAAALAVLNVAEGLYLDWALKAPKPMPDSFVHAEWITLHDNPDFRPSLPSCKPSWTALARRKPHWPVISTNAPSSWSWHSSMPSTRRASEHGYLRAPQGCRDPTVEQLRRP